jgi:SpoVK/Ycf46/Vps4 family AAA+-type ATPase
VVTGTGKTTVARVIADVLFGLGLKPSNKIVEKSALDLTANYEGQTTTKVTEALKEAKGGVLFIDEAYNLGQGSFGKEACDTIVQAMTSDEFADVLIVIAGYPSEINDMLNTNIGLKSRFTEFFEFPNWEPEDCVAFFEMCATNEQFTVEEGVLEKVEYGCSVVRALDGWGNGRDVKKLWEEAKSQRAQRVYSFEVPEIPKRILLKDVKAGVESLIQARIPGATLPEEGSDPLEKLDKLYRMDKVKEKLEQMRKTWAVAKRDGMEKPKVGHFVFTGSPGKNRGVVCLYVARCS